MVGTKVFARMTEEQFAAALEEKEEEYKRLLKEKEDEVRQNAKCRKKWTLNVCNWNAVK